MIPNYHLLFAIQAFTFNLFTFSEKGVAKFTPSNTEPNYLGSHYKKQLTRSNERRCSADFGLI
jgi:hypothetical protein